MSLQVWLPLNGDLHNQGLSNYTISMMRGSAVFDNNGKIGKCFYANGVNTIRIENIISDFYNYSGYSLCVWFYIEAQNTTHNGSGIVSAGNWNNQILNLALSGWSTDHYTQLQVSGTSWNKIYNYTFNKNTWYHVVVSSDGNKTYAYVNGTLIGNTQPGFLPTSIEGNNIAIGGATYYGGMQFFGKINDVRIYDHCLSDKEIKEIAKGLVLHYKLDNIIDNNIYDCSGYQNNGTIVGTLSVDNNTSRYGKSILFNGTDACIRVPYKECNPDGIFTLNLWFYKDALGSKNYETLFGGPSGFEMDTRSGSSTTLSLYMASTRGGNIFSPFSLNTWYMVTMIRDGTNEMYYINGELKKTIEAKPMPNGVYRIGAWASDTGQNYYGNMSDFRIYATALLEEDVLDLYHTPFSIDNKGNSYAREVIESEEENINITKTGQFHGNEMLDNNDYTTASITKDDKQLKVNTLYEH